MAIYKYIGSYADPMNFNYFSEIKNKLKIGDKIVFCDGNNSPYYLPKYQIKSSDSYEKLLKETWDLSGLKVKISFYNNRKFDHVLEWIRCYGNITLDCTQMNSEDATFFIGNLTKNELSTQKLGPNEMNSTNCFNIIPVKYDSSSKKFDFRGLETRRIFVIPSYRFWMIYAGAYPIVPTGGFSKESSPGYAKAYHDKYTDGNGNVNEVFGGQGFWGGGKTGGRGGAYKLSETSEKPEGYMPESEYSKYIPIISDVSLREFALNMSNPDGGRLELTIEILDAVPTKTFSTMQYFDGKKLIKSYPYRYDGKKFKQCDAYYFNGNELIKL